MQSRGGGGGMVAALSPALSSARFQGIWPPWGWEHQGPLCAETFDLLGGRSPTNSEHPSQWLELRAGWSWPPVVCVSSALGVASWLLQIRKAWEGQGMDPQASKETTPSSLGFGGEGVCREREQVFTADLTLLLFWAGSSHVQARVSPSLPPSAPFQLALPFFLVTGKSFLWV